ncbi:MAG: alpha/beta hydrolase [Kiloniellales bacterium]|nr:alpha/beta hydrolase [Kiloniellales bacterium]
MSDTVFLHYDQAQLDAQINLRARWPEHEAYFARWAKESAAFRAERTGQLNLRYGATTGQTLDLFPAAEGPAPLIAFIHGGYWQALDKSDFSYLGAAFLDHGIAYASLNYDLAPDTGIGEMVAQIRRAFGWLQAEAPGLGLDPRRIVALGHSAGGHLAAMASATDWRAAFGLREPALAAAGSISGIYDLEPMRLCYQQPVLQIDPETVRDMSPLRIAPPPGARLVCAVGGEETEEFRRQQAAFAADWRRQGAELEALVIEGQSHFSILDLLLAPEHPLTAGLIALTGV